MKECPSRGHQSTSCNWQKQKHSLLVTGEDLVRIGASTGRWAEKDIWKVARHGDQADKALVGVPLVMGRSGIAFFVPWVPVLAFMDLTILFGIRRPGMPDHGASHIFHFSLVRRVHCSWNQEKPKEQPGKVSGSGGPFPAVAVGSPGRAIAAWACPI